MVRIGEIDFSGVMRCWIPDLRITCRVAISTYFIGQKLLMRGRLIGIDDLHEAILALLFIGNIWTFR